MKKLFFLFLNGLFLLSVHIQAQSLHLIDDFEDASVYYTAFNYGSGTVSASLNSSDFVSGQGSLQMDFQFNAGQDYFFSAMRNYTTNTQDYSFRTNGFSLYVKGGTTADAVALRFWEDINQNGAFDGEDEVYTASAHTIGTTVWDSVYFDLNDFTRVAGSGNDVLDLNRVRAWDIAIKNTDGSSHSGSVLIDRLQLHSAYTQPSSGSMQLNGSFIQLWNTAGCMCGQWTQNEWDAELQKMKDACMNTLVIQYGVYKDLSWYQPSSLSFINYTEPTLNKIISAANKVDMDVYLGLYFDETWNTSDKSASSTYSGLLDKHKQVIDEIWDLFKDSASFAGWYIPQEINDLEWQSDPQKTLLFNWLRDVSDYAHAKSATHPVMIAPYCNLWQPADLIQQWYDDMLTTATNIDMIYPQDGIGTHIKDLGYTEPLYGTAIATACQLHNKTFGITLESFDQLTGWPVDNGSFSATSATLDRIKQQLWSAEDLSASGIVQFSWMYMQPDLSTASTTLYNDYKSFSSCIPTGIRKTNKNTPEFVFDRRNKTVSFSHAHKHVRILNVLGEVCIYTENTKQIDLSHLHTGIYLITTDNNDTPGKIFIR